MEKQKRGACPGWKRLARKRAAGIAQDGREGEKKAAGTRGITEWVGELVSCLREVFDHQG